jgi:hypothetical protein
MIRVLEKGQLKGSFRGFRNRDTIFEFGSGGKWRQKYYKYHYHYAYMPRAVVIEDHSGCHLQVDGVAEKVEVVRVR